jgi:Putative zinc-finger
VNHKRCPTEVELLNFVDGELPPEQLRRIAEHVASCGACEPQVATLHSLIADIKAPLRRSDTETNDVAAHVASVLARLDEPVKTRQTDRALWGWATTFTAAAAAVLLWIQLAPPTDETLARDGTTQLAQTALRDVDTGEFTARGSASEASLARDVGVQLYTFKQPLEPLQPGTKIPTSTALTAGLRNLARNTAHLLLFAIDSKHAVHWIAPAFTSAASDPPAYAVHPSQKEQPLPSSVTFEDLAVGSLRVMALITTEPLHVSDIEKLTPQQLNEDFALRFPRAVVREVVVEVIP